MLISPKGKEDLMLIQHNIFPPPLLVFYQRDGSIKDEAGRENWSDWNYLSYSLDKNVNQNKMDSLNEKARRLTWLTKVITIG